jgi:hypothetical protein
MDDDTHLPYLARHQVLGALEFIQRTLAGNSMLVPMVILPRPVEAMSYQQGSACIPSHSIPVVRKGCHSEETFLMPATRIEIVEIDRSELRYRSWLRFLFVQMRESVSLVLAKSDSVQAPLPPPVRVVNVS